MIETNSKDTKKERRRGRREKGRKEKIKEGRKEVWLDPQYRD